MIFQAFREGMTVEEAHALSTIDPWFLRQLRELVQDAVALGSQGELERVDDAALRRSKADGVSDRALAQLLHTDETAVRAHRWKRGRGPSRLSSRRRNSPTWKSRSKPTWFFSASRSISISNCEPSRRICSTPLNGGPGYLLPGLRRL